MKEPGILDNFKHAVGKHGGIQNLTHWMIAVQGWGSVNITFGEASVSTRLPSNKN